MVIKVSRAWLFFDLYRNREEEKHGYQEKLKKFATLLKYSAICFIIPYLKGINRKYGRTN
jgi:hypothetical protein